MKSRRTHKHCSECPKQCFCGSTRRLEDNHLGGEKHVGWLWLPFCGPNHDQFHVNCRRAGVDFGKQKTKLMGQIPALKAQLVGFWMVVEQIEKQVRRKGKNHGRNA